MESLLVGVLLLLQIQFVKQFWCRDSNSLIQNHITYYCEIFYALENSYCFTRLIFAKLKKIVFVNQIFVKFYFRKNIEKLHNS